MWRWRKKLNQIRRTVRKSRAIVWDAVIAMKNGPSAYKFIWWQVTFNFVFLLADARKNSVPVPLLQLRKLYEQLFRYRNAQLALMRFNRHKTNWADERQVFFCMSFQFTKTNWSSIKQIFLIPNDIIHCNIHSPCARKPYSWWKWRLNKPNPYNLLNN